MLERVCVCVNGCSYGIFVNSDAVIRTVYHKYHHPKEALISNGVVNQEIARLVTSLHAEATNYRELTRCCFYLHR
jgi:hypothetical protein